MKRKIIRWFTLIAVLCASLSYSLAQTAVINYIDANGYPNIKAFYTYKDIAGKQVRPPNYNWVPQDIIIKEEGKNRNHNPGSPKCADPNQKAFSAILVFDISNSMQKGMLGENDPPPGQAKWEVAFKAMDHFIRALDPALTECAIIEFGQLAGIRKWFTNDKDSLLQIVSQIPSFELRTNYNAAFLRNKKNVDGNIIDDSSQSPLYIAKFAKYKPVIIFLTDGKHNPGNLNGDDGPFEVGKAYTKAQQNGVYVFVVKIGNEALDATSDNNLRLMAGVEGSIDDNLAMNVTDPDALLGFYDKVIQICGAVGYPAPCYVEWTSECGPSGARSLDLTFQKAGDPVLTASSSFTVNSNLKPNLVFTPNKIEFKNIAPPNNSQQTVKVTAINNYVDFFGSGFTSTDPHYTVINWGGIGPKFRLDKDASRTFTIRYEPTDSFCTSGFIEFPEGIVSSSCGGRLPVSGILDQFVLDVDMGDATVNTNKDVKVTNVFCNRSCSPITITAINFTTGDATTFSHHGLTLPITLDPRDCITDTFTFSPKSQGRKSSKINIVIDTGAGNATLVSDITGNGIGLPGINSYNPVVFPNTDCDTTTRDTLVYLKNTGPIVLNIDSVNSNLEGPNKDEFNFSPRPLPSHIDPNDSIAITFSFIPKKSGVKQCSLHVISDADGNENYYIQLDAIADSVDFAPDTTINLGVVCLGDTVNTNFNLRNVGTKSLHITASAPSTMTLNTPPWDLNGGESEIVNVTYIPTTDGPINSNIVFTEDLCNIQKTVRFIGTVHDPKVTNANVIVTSNVGVAKIDTIRITNPSTSVPLFINSITTSDPQFSFISSIPPIPGSIPPGGFMDIIISYLPDTALVLNAGLILSGMPCHDVIIPMVGNPSLAMVDIVINEDYTGLVGEKKNIIVYLTNAKMFAESGTSTIDYEVSFDASLLKQAPPGNIPETMSGSDRVLHITGKSVRNHNSFQVIDTLRLLVTDGNVDSTILNIEKTVSNKRNVAFNEDDGLFRLIEASAKLYTKFYEKSPGEEFELEIWQSDAVNLSSFHGSITTEVRCNPFVLEGVGLDDTLENGDRYVKLTGIPINNSESPQMLKSFKFRPMLGPVDSTYLKLANSRSENGMIKFDTVDGMLKLKVCIDADGTKRLFDPNGGTALIEAVNPNPTSGITEIKFTLSEPGLTNIWLSNVLGDKILNVANDDMKPGNKTLYFDANDLPDGVYFVIMQTPTQLFKKRFNIIK